MIIDKIHNALSKIHIADLELLKKLVNSSSQVILIGNGGSNAISSHISVDYIKFLNKKSLAFSDPSMLTAYNNDYGVENAYSMYIKDMVQDNSLVILISSSGNSENIYNAAKYCIDNNIDLVLLTGFSDENKVRKAFGSLALLDYWVDSSSYGVVECVHQIFLHSIIDN